jgi:hypothetical protein
MKQVLELEHGALNLPLRLQLLLLILEHGEQQQKPLLTLLEEALGVLNQLKLLRQKLLVQLGVLVAEVVKVQAILLQTQQIMHLQESQLPSSVVAWVNKSLKKKL